MDKEIIIWLIIFAVSAVVFFVIAAVVAVKGFGDLKKLLRHTKRHGRMDENK